jgi:hypothetical protein
MKLYALIIASGSYDYYTRTVVGITTNELYAQAWPLIALTTERGDDSYEVETFELDNLEAPYAEQLQAFLDRHKNPLCECGHTLEEHTKRGKKRCRHNHEKYPVKPFHCDGFRLAVYVVQPPLAPPLKVQ